MIARREPDLRGWHVGPKRSQSQDRKKIQENYGDTETDNGTIDTAAGIGRNDAPLKLTNFGLFYRPIEFALQAAHADWVVPLDPQYEALTINCLFIRAKLWFECLSLIFALSGTSVLP